MGSNAIQNPRRIVASTGGSGGSGTGTGFTAVVANYAALPAVGTVTGKFYWVSASTGTNLAGPYYSNGVTWEHSPADDITVVANYSALPAANTVTGQFYWCSASQGTKWIGGLLFGGTYYNSGLYYSNGVTWESIESPYQATQAEVNTGTNNDKFVTPSTLANWSGLGNYVPYTGATTTVDLGTNKILVGNGSAAAPSIGISSSPTSGFWKNTTYSALNWGSGGVFGGLFEASGLYVKSTGVLSFLNSDLESGTGDAVIRRVGSGILGLGAANGSSAQTLRIFGDNFNNKYLNLTHDGTDGLLTTNTGVIKIQGLTITASTGTLTLANSSSLITTGAFNTTLATSFSGTITLPGAASTLATLALSESFTNKTLTSSTNTIGGITWGLGSDAVGDLHYTGTSNVNTRLASVAAGSYLRSGGVTTAPVWSTLILPNSATVNRIAYATSSNTWGDNSLLTFDGTTFTANVLSANGTYGQVSKNQNAQTTFYVSNSTSGNAAAANVRFINDLGTNVQFGVYSSTTTAYGVIAGGNSYIYSGSDIAFGTETAFKIGTGSGAVLRLTISSAGLFSIWDSGNIALGTTTGTKFGTATSQKLAFYNSTPIVQPTTSVATSTFTANTSGIVDDSATFGGYKISQIVKALQTLGLLA